MSTLSTGVQQDTVSHNMIFKIPRVQSKITGCLKQEEIPSSRGRRTHKRQHQDDGEARIIRQDLKAATKKCSRSQSTHTLETENEVAAKK